MQRSGAIWVALPALSLEFGINAASCWGGAPPEPVCIRVQVEKAFDALSERAQGEILKAAQSQAEHRTDALLQAVDMDQFVRGTAESSTSCILLYLAPASISVYDCCCRADPSSCPEYQHAQHWAVSAYR